jgi:hypothetical protein
MRKSNETFHQNVCHSAIRCVPNFCEDCHIAPVTHRELHIPNRSFLEAVSDTLSMVAHPSGNLEELVFVRAFDLILSVYLCFFQRSAHKIRSIRLFTTITLTVQLFIPPGVQTC